MNLTNSYLAGRVELSCLSAVNKNAGIILTLRRVKSCHINS